jgi:hypothetical protein
MLNVREATVKQLTENEEISNLKKIIGLRQGAKYDNNDEFSSLRYGRIIILTDQDTDGSHIKGLVMNMFHCVWPELVQREGFITSMSTPIVKAFKNKDIKTFYNLTEYEDWLESNPIGWKIKYYKGLGTSTASEAKEYFVDINDKLIKYNWEDDEDENNALTLAFQKNRADDRKEWLMSYDRNEILTYEEREVSYNDFIHKDLKHFSNYDNSRSIPHIMDGFKPSQRKILYGAFLRGLDKDEVKVAQLAGFVSDKAAYHHGEMSLNGAIVGMAQDFVGSNNINTLAPLGQFGCLAPDTPILMWEGNIKYAKDIKIGDILIGDDGDKREVLNITNGIDDMYKINMSNGKTFTVNSQHILTLYFTNNMEIKWKKSSSMWYIIYYDNKSIKQKSFQTDKSTNNNHYNASKLTKEEAYEKINEFRNTIIKEYGDSKIIDIKLCDYIQLSNTNKDDLYMLNNINNIKWDYKPVPINPYIFGAWLGDGDHNGHGFTSIDDEIIRTFAIYADTINAEITHHPNHGREDCYHYGIRRKNSGYQLAIGDKNNSSATCIACQDSKMKHPSCDWYFEKSPETINYGKTIHGHTRNDLNPFKELLKQNNLYKNKHIPDIYIYNDEDTRLQLLAGFIDTDGRIRNNDTTNPSYEISQSDRIHGHLIDSLNIISQSLGFATSITYTYHGITKKNENITMKSLNIYGPDLYRIPVKLPRKKFNKTGDVKRATKHYSTFTIESLGKGEFYGWSIDKNERFLLGDFTVTHNSRSMGGKDAASPRYIFTKLTKEAQLIFRKIDNNIVNNQEEDGMPIEPEYYAPIIPMILVNGATGIGTGFSTEIPCFNPIDIINNILSLIKNNTTDTMTPYWRGFNGTVERVGESNTYETKGIYSIKKNKLIITELPIGTWTQNYKEFLEKLYETEQAKKSKDDKNFINYKEFHTDKSVHFELEFTDGYIERVKDIYKEFHLTSKVSINNMHLYSVEGRITKYDSIDSILREYYNKRVIMYEERRKYQLNQLKYELDMISNKVKFILMVVNDKLVINKRKRAELEDELEENDFEKMGNNKNYDYLLGMPIYQLTHEKIEELKKQEKEKTSEYKLLDELKATDIWKNELIELKASLETIDNSDKKVTKKK